MQLSYNGLTCFTIRGKTATIVTDPFDPKATGVSLKKLKGDIVTLSREKDPQFSLERVEADEKEKLSVVDWPGEYEYKQVSVIGIQTWQNKKGEKGEDNPNTVFTYYVDDIHICHLGKLGHSLTTEQIDEIGDVDILLVPISSSGSFDAHKALEVVEKIEPRMVIPMYYSVPGAKEKLESVDKFIKIIGSGEKMETLKISRRELPSEEETKVIVLECK